MSLPKFLALDWKEFLPLLQKPQLEKSFWNAKPQNAPSTVVLENGHIVSNTAKASVRVKDKKDYFVAEGNDFLQANSQNLDCLIEIEAKEDEFIHITHYVSGAHVQACKIVARQGAHLQVEEQIISKPNSYVGYNMMIHAQQEAKVDYHLVQDIHGKSVFCTQAKVEQNANLHFAKINLGEGTFLETNTIHLVGTEAAAEVKQLILANKQDKMAHLVEMVHKQKNTTSQMDNLALLNGEALVHIDGTNIIEKGQAKSQASQHTRMINLSPKAKAVANPQLGIDEYDVKAGHAATVGMLDEEQIYYMQSRGLTRKEAVALLLEASMQPYLNDFSAEMVESIKKQMEQKIK